MNTKRIHELLKDSSSKERLNNLFKFNKNELIRNAKIKQKIKPKTYKDLTHITDEEPKD